MLLLLYGTVDVVWDDGNQNMLAQMPGMWLPKREAPRRNEIVVTDTHNI